MQANSRPTYLNAHAASDIRVNPKIARIYVYGMVFPCFNDLNFRRSLYHSYFPARKAAVERVLAELERRADEGLPTGIDDEYERAKRDRIILYGGDQEIDELQLIETPLLPQNQTPEHCDYAGIAATLRDKGQSPEARQMARRRSKISELDLPSTDDWGLFQVKVSPTATYGLAFYARSQAETEPFVDTLYRAMQLWNQQKPFPEDLWGLYALRYFKLKGGQFSDEYIEQERPFYNRICAAEKAISIASEVPPSAF